MKKVISLLVCLLLSISLSGQRATITDTTLTFRTYGYSDPDPVPRVGKIYPYFRFDAYTTEPEDRDWQVIILENDWIRVLIAPEIGGKILGAIEKSTGYEFLYYNRVIKFRDVAMRGPWTSGGIEFNFGSIGHAPTTAAPVDYLLRENPDGSVSCFLGAADLPSRTEWRVEVRLPDDRAWFETHALWYNPTDLSTSKYHWMNAAADASQDLTYFFPGTHYIGHGGDVHAWPVMADGRNISRYAENDYGTYHSYHVLGAIEDWFAGYYDHRDFGFGHLTDYALKPGKKIWIWGLSRQGEIWVDLLTDPELGNIQYTEIQTGLLFNQAGEASSRTPFKHLHLASHESERFTEYWFPIIGTGGVSDINEFGIVHLKEESQAVGQTAPSLQLCALQHINDTIWIQTDDHGNLAFYAKLEPMETLQIPLSGDVQQSGIRLWTDEKPVSGRIRFDCRTQDSDQLTDRPMETPQAFDERSVQARYLAAVENARQRNYKQALEGFYSCLEEDPHYIPALRGASEELIRTMRYEQAENLLKRVLSIDTYDPGANYLLGIVKKYQEEYPRAREAFGIATRSMAYRHAALVQLADISLKMGDYHRGLEYASSALDYNRFSIRALQLTTTLYRLMNRPEEAFHALEVLLGMDPLNHQARFEAWLLTGSDAALSQFQSHIRNEFPEQSYLELALYYLNLNLPDDAGRVLENAPENPLADYLIRQIGTSRLTEAISPEPRVSDLLFPYRQEMYDAISQAEEEAPHWINRYYMGLIHWNFGQLTEARDYFRSCGTEPTRAAFYLARARLFAGADTELVVHDLDYALKIDPDNWRVYHDLSNFYLSNHLYEEALSYARKGVRRFGDHLITRLTLARTELLNGRYADCLQTLDGLAVLPAEGATAARDLYRQAHLLLAVSRFHKGQTDEALQHIDQARAWPEHLGAGKPYVTDERVENYLEGLIRMHLGEDDRAAAAFRRVVQYTEKQRPAFGSPWLLVAFSLQFLGQADEAVALLSDWLSRHPGDAIAHWASAQYAGNPEQAERALSSWIASEGGTPWNPGGGDPQFRLVYEVVNQIPLR